jgi:hypothetical protein
MKRRKHKKDSNSRRNYKSSYWVDGLLERKKAKELATKDFME